GRCHADRRLRITSWNDTSRRGTRRRPSPPRRRRLAPAQKLHRPLPPSTTAFYRILPSTEPWNLGCTARGIEPTDLSVRVPFSSHSGTCGSGATSIGAAPLLGNPRLIGADHGRF